MHFRKLTALLALAGLLVGVAFVAAAESEAGKKKKKGVPLDKRFDTKVLAGGFQRPITFDYLPNGKMLVGEKTGGIFIVDKSGNAKPLLSITGHLIARRERGLEGLAVTSGSASGADRSGRRD